MRLKRLELKQFCQHTDRVIDFPVGVTGIIGPNASGKSNIIHALRFALLGESGNVGTKADDMNWDAAPDAQGGSVKLKFECGGIDGEVSRAITTARASLKHGDRHEKSVSTVNPAMLDIAGLPKKTIQDVIFVMQGKIEEILFEEPADRKKRFQGLFGIDKAEPLRVILQRELAEIGEPPSDERLQTLQTQLDTSIDPQLRELCSRRDTLAADLATVNVEAMQTIVAAHAARQAATVKLQELTARSGSIQSAINKVRAELPAQLTPEDEAKLVELVERAEQLRTELTELESKKGMATAIKGWEAEKVRCQQLQQMPVPVQTATAESINEARNAVAAASEQLAPKRAFVAAFEGSDGVVVCPTCGETVRNAEERVQSFKAEIAATNEQLKQLSEMIRESEKAHRKYIQEYTQYEATQRHVAERLAEIQESLLHAGDLASVQADAEKAAKLRGMLEELMAGSDQLMQRKKEASAGDVKVAQLAGQLGEVKKQHSLLTAEAANTPLVSDEEATQAQAAINNVTAWTAEHANLDGQISQLQSNRATVIADMDRLKEQIAQSDGLKKYRQYCERARTLLHHDCLPMIVTQSYLAALNAKLNEYLRTFNATFTSTIKDDLAVVCNFGSDVERAAGRLSGGQKVALSIAFRFAVYSLFAGSFGFMALDEPTAYLDDDRISCVVELLQQVRQYAHSSGMQLIVPTHEPALMAAVDSVVELS